MMKSELTGAGVQWGELGLRMAHSRADSLDLREKTEGDEQLPAAGIRTYFTMVKSGRAAQ